MENDKSFENPVKEAERLSGRLHTSAEPEKSGSFGCPGESIVGLFETVAAANPDKIAIVCGNNSQTYGALNSKANYLARHLRELGVRPDSFVAIYLDRSPEMMVAMLGILKAGGAYLPI